MKMSQMIAKSLLVVAGLLSSAQMCAYKSHKIQVILDPTNEAWNPQYSFWALNTVAGGISYNFAALRSPGAYSVSTGLIFPKGTVSKYQANYNVDKDGVALNANNRLGTWMASDFILTQYDYTTFPEAGTFLSAGNWACFFNDTNEQDNLYMVGRQKANELAIGTKNPVQYGRFDVNAGTGKYSKSQNRPGVVSVRFFLSAAGNALIKIEFDKEIKVSHLD